MRYIATIHARVGVGGVHLPNKKERKEEREKKCLARKSAYSNGSPGIVRNA